MNVNLQPLRIPTGWRIDWNTLFEEDPTAPANPAGYYDGGTNLFQAVHAQRRQAIDIDWWTPLEQPRAGCYRMQVLRMIDKPAPRGDKNVELAVSWDDPIHRFETRSRLELVEELEAWLEGSTTKTSM